MNQNIPLSFSELTNLQNFQIEPKSFKFGVSNIESQKYITVHDSTSTGENFLTIIEMENNLQFTRKPSKADAALMHPNQKIIALKAKQSDSSLVVLQIINMDTREKLKYIEVEENIQYWKWVNANKLSFVTSSTVQTLDISKPNEQQVKVLDRAGPLIDCQIIGFAMEQEEKWCALYGIKTPDGGKTINGHIQLFFIQGGKQQFVEGFSCCFGEAPIHSDDYNSLLFSYVEKKSNEINSKVQIIEIGTPKEGFQKHKKISDIQFAPDHPNDFPLYMQMSKKYGIIYIVTKFGYLFIYELSTCCSLLRVRISDSIIFSCARNQKTDGIILMNKNGQVLQFQIDDTKLVNYINSVCTHIPDNVGLSFKMATRFGLPGAEKYFLEQFNQSMMNQNYQNAAKLAATAPGTLLRNADTIQKFKQLQPIPSQPQPILIYFQTLLEKGKLNAIETIELARPVVAQNRQQLIKNWMDLDKLTLCEELGDILRPIDSQIAIQIYEKSNSISKLQQIYMETGQFDKAMQYSSQTGIKPDYISMLRNMIPINPENALNTAKQLYQRDPSINVHQIAELFQNFNRLQEMTAFLTDCMKNNNPEDGVWQTKVLEQNLLVAPQVSEAIMQMGIWNQYNKQRIALLFEQKGLAQRALENYTDIKDIRRVVLNTHILNSDWLISYFSSLQNDWILVCLQDLLRHNRQNLNLVVQIAQKNIQKLNVADVLKIFESSGAYDGVYYFLGSILNNTTDFDIHFKYIEAAVKFNQFNEVERVIKEKQNCYDPIKVKDYLKEIKLANPKSLIYLCDMHGFIPELIKYLYQNNFNKFIEIYLLRVNPNSAPQVLGTLIDLECEETMIKQILYNIRGNCPLEQLVEEFDNRNKLRLLSDWLNQRISEGNQLPQVHNALAKLKIDTNQEDTQQFLMNNQFYDSKVVGKYCESHDPHLAFTVYKRAWGQCDTELIEVSNKNNLYRLQARYLVERQSKELWQFVLSPDNPHRKEIIDQVITSALPDSKNVDEVSTTVQAFMAADLSHDLINLLEKIVLHNSEFGKYNKLQNLLIITAIKTDQKKVMDYIKRLENYDGPDIARIALGEKYQLNEEAFVIYDKQKHYLEAIESLDRSQEYAKKVNQNEVWSRLGQAYLDHNQINDAIECFLKANDHNSYPYVISHAENNGEYENLIKYLIMARQQVRDMIIDNSLCFCYSKLEKLNDLEELINGANSADIQKVGDRCYHEKLYEAAKILFVNIKNNAKISSCLIRLKQYQPAIEAAKKANTPKSWKEVCIACVEAQEYKLAAFAGLNIIVHPDHLEDLIKTYEENAVPNEMIALLQQGMNQERAHIGIYTELGVMLAKYQPQKLMEHCKLYFQKINIAKLLRVCERFQLWPEAVFLYENYDEFDNAINIMIEHSPSAWNHELFITLLQKVANHDLYYKSIIFYYEEQPMQLNDLLKSMASKLDLTKTVRVLKQIGCIELATEFLEKQQNQNNQDVNEALNEIYLQYENYDSLNDSIRNNPKFEAESLARATENHDLLEFRRIASFLYRKLEKYDKAINLSKKDHVYRDAIETALESGNQSLVEDLLKYFVKNNNKEFFTVCLYTCYELIKPDIALELAWRFGLLDFCMPYFIQITRELTQRIETVQKKHDAQEKKQEKQAQQQQEQHFDVPTLLMPGLSENMLMAPPDMGNLNGLQPQMQPYQPNMNIYQDQYGFQGGYQM